MNNNTLPTDNLKKYGIIEADNSFSKKLSAKDIQNFLQGYTIVADNEKNRITFQLTNNNSELKVNLYERDKNLSEVLENSKNGIEYSNVFTQYNVNDEKHSAQASWTKAAFIYDKETNSVKEYDFIKNAAEIVKIVGERKDAGESNRFRVELQKLQSFLQDKIDKYPEIAKEITVDMNIVSNAINAVNSISPDEKQAQTQGKSDIQLNVNDQDLYEDANQQREEDQEQEEEWSRPKGRGR